MVRKKETETTSSLSGHNFLKQMIKETKNEYASVASEGTVYDTVSYIDLGNYLLNKQAGGDMFKGIAGNPPPDPISINVFPHTLSTPKILSIKCFL